MIEIRRNIILFKRNFECYFFYVDFNYIKNIIIIKKKKKKREKKETRFKYFKKYNVKNYYNKENF